MKYMLSRELELVRLLIVGYLLVFALLLGYFVYFSAKTKKCIRAQKHINNVK